jgi:hypothetical protein
LSLTWHSAHNRFSFGSNYGGVNKNIKGHQNTYAKANNAVLGHKANQGFLANQGYNKLNAGHVNNALKKGQFGAVGAVSKAAKNDGTVYGNNDVVVKAAKGTKFAQKGISKKGHATKGFRNQHHKVLNVHQFKYIMLS